MFFFFFFKQKTAYEMRISDWSSDVCSSDLEAGAARLVGQVGAGLLELLEDQLAVLRRHAAAIVGDRDLQALRTRLRRHDHMAGPLVAELGRVRQQNGRASCRERVCQSV